jgi:hypothetical protein
MPGKWHNAMENLFPKEMHEIKFFCSSKYTNVCRKADILLNKKRTCEIQHSYISEKEIIDRFNDWCEFGKEIIWLIDGNEGIDFYKLSTGNYLIKFIENWKYKSFMKTYKFILLERDGNVFKIELDKIKSGMIELKESKLLNETIEFLKKNPDNIYDLWSDDNIIKSTLCVYQQGAGNGKTYGIWKSIAENIDKKTYVIVTKQHSAKTVIYEELMDQMKRFENGQELYHIENIQNHSQENTEKHYVFKYTHKTSKKECIVIIGTIDSFCYNLSNSNATGADFFEGIINNIKDNGANKLNNGFMKYAGQYIQLCKECEIWIDEVQDLPENYLYAMCKLMYETSCYINVVGDKLQTLEFNNNFLTSIINEGLPNINIDLKEHININKRIKVTNMGDKINEIIDFNKYNLPIIESDINIEKIINDEPIKIIESPEIYANDNHNEKISNYCKNIMKEYIKEVDTNNYIPNDFLIIFPIMKGNIISCELETRIQEYWVNKYTNDKYTRYVYIHKHTEGTVINTNDSINATRIMSIKSSKGDGRKVVFALNITEMSLKIISNNEIGLIYESLLHVALTRAKNQIYFGLIKNNDDIHKRFGECGYIDYLPPIKNNINISKIIQFINKDNFINLFNKNINQEDILNNDLKINQSETVDWGYHCIKYYTYYYNVILHIINNKNESKSHENSQLFVVIDIISERTIIEYNVIDFWKYLYEYQNKNLPIIPLCIISSKPEYKLYSKIINNAMINVQKHIQLKSIHKLNVYESIILTYMILLYTNKTYCDITPMDIYNITDYFQDNTKEKLLLMNIENIMNIISKSGINNDYQNINWNIFKHFELYTKEDYIKYFKIYKYDFPIIGNNEKDIIHIALKSNISSLNFWDVMIEILLERFIIYNHNTKDSSKYENKKINTYIYLLDTNDYIKIDWSLWEDKILTNDIKIEIKKVMELYYQNYHNGIYKNFIYNKNKKIEIWNNNPDIIIDDFITKIKEFPKYIIDVFNDINTKIQDGDEYSYINIFEKFNDKLNKKLNVYLNKYLDLKVSYETP